MQHRKHASNIAELAIHKMIDSLHQLFLLGTTKKEKIDELIEKRNSLDENNNDYCEIRQDKRENMKLWWQLVLIFCSIVIDFVLVYQPMDIICNTFNLPALMKYLAPMFLIILEVGIAYSQILHHRHLQRSTWFMRNLQYLVIVILGAFSALLILFTVNNYNPSIDGSFLGFVTGTILFQLGLLCASIMLHVWLIRNAELLSETLAYFLYILERKNLSSKIAKLEKMNKEKHSIDFKNASRELIRKIELFKRDAPGADVHFEKTMPLDLIKAINQVMGKTVFSIESEYV